MNLTIVKVIFFKEMLDTLRDKRTLIAMVGVPVILYPALFLVMAQVAVMQSATLEKTASKVVIRADEASPLRPWVEKIEQVDVMDSEDPEGDLQKGEIDAVVVAEGPIDSVLAQGKTVPIEIRFDSTKSPSRKAADRIVKGLRGEGQALLKERLDTKGLEESFARPLDVQRKNVAPPSKVTGLLLGMILPLIMIVMLGVGAFYPAVDLTAGEKERGTFETLLSTPASKLEIVSGKFLTVFTLSMVTGLLNLASMLATMLFQLSQLTDQLTKLGEPFELEILKIPPQSILAMLVMLVPLAFFISSLMMAVAVLARSFKEAQNYVTPVFIAILLPGMVGAIPDIELSPTTQFIPIANVALLFRDLMMGEASIDMVFVVFICTTVYALLGVLAATWMFQREDVILSEEKGLPLSIRRSEFIPRDLPTLGTAFGILALALLLLFYAGTYAQGKNIQIGLLITEYLLLLAPILLILWFIRVDIVKTLNLHMPRPGVIIGTLLIAPSCLIVLIQVGVWQNKILPLPEEFARFAELLFDIGDSSWGLPALFFVVAVSPAICEEALFRGVLISGLRPRMPQWAVIVIVGVLFGLFHLSVYRFVPTGLIGMVLTYLVIRSGSILPGVIGHLIVNGSSVLLQTEHVPQSLIRYLEENNIEEKGLPLWILGVALLVFATGVIAVEGSVRSRDAENGT